MGNIDCTTPQVDKQSTTQQLKFNYNKSLKIAFKRQSIIINGDEGAVLSQTKRQTNLQQSTLTQQKPKPSKPNQKTKKKATENHTTLFMNQLLDDNNYSKKQMAKLQTKAFTKQPNFQKMKPTPDYGVCVQYQKFIQEQNKFLQEKKDLIDQESQFKISYQDVKVKPLQPFNGVHKSRQISRNSSFSKNSKQGVTRLVSELDTIVKKDDQKMISNTQTSNLMQLILHLEKMQGGNKKQQITNLDNVKQKEIVTNILQEDSNKQPSYEIQIFIDDVPSKLVVKEGDNLNQLLQNFIKQHELPQQFHDKMLEALNENFEDLSC